MSKMQELATQLGVSVLDEKTTPIPGLLQAIIYGAKGVFNHEYPNIITVMSLCEEEEKDAVIAHELGHVFSYKNNHNNWGLYIQLRRSLNSEDREAAMFMLHVEEFRADMFSIHVCNRLSLHVPEWVYSFRIKMHQQNLTSQMLYDISRESIWMAENYVLNEVMR